MATYNAEQLPFAIESLQQVEHGIGYPDVLVAVDRDAFGMGKAARTIAVFTELADEVAVGVEDLYSVIHGVGDVYVAIFIDRDEGRQREIAGGRKLVLLASGTDATLLFQGVSVVHHNLIGLGINHIELTVFTVDSDADWIDKT